MKIGKLKRFVNRLERLDNVMHKFNDFVPETKEEKEYWRAKALFIATNRMMERYLNGTLREWQEKKQRYNVSLHVQEV